jgi:S1-C subfamily serine protease
MTATSAANSFRFHCPACGRALDAPTDAVGRRANCPHCRASIKIPPGLCGLVGGTEPSPSSSTTTEDPADSSVALQVAPTTPEPPSWRDVIHARRSAVALIECSAGVGSGLLVSLDGLLVTNRHVVEKADVFMVRFHDGSKSKGVLVHANGGRDLAVVRAAVRRDAFFDLDRDVADSVHAGDDVLAIGHPRGLAFTSTRGIISEPNRRLADGEYVQTDVAINPGNSGGPLLDRHGKLVGLNTRIQNDSEGLGFAIGGSEVRAYVLFVLDQVKRRVLHVPTDAEIAAATQKLSPWDIAVAGVQASGLPHRALRARDGSTRLRVQSPGGCAFDVCVGGNLFYVTGCVAAGLTDKQQRDGKLLQQLFKWQNELCGPCFELQGNNVSIGIRRSVEGLDVPEAREAILRVSDAMDALLRPILRMLGR